MTGKLFSAEPPRVATIAGSDSGGGAGIQADLKTFQALGAYGLSVVTALTAQNTQGVQGIHAVPPEFVVAQLESVRSDIRIDAWKVGMLADTGIIKALGTELRKGQDSLAPLVLDPVMVSTSGSLLLSNDSIKALIQELLPLCAVLTPNLPEARQLLKHSRGQTADTLANGKVPQEEADSLSTLRSLVDAAHELSQLGPRATLVKGGHQVMKRQDFERGLVELGVELTAGLSVDAAAAPVDRALLGAEVFSGVLQSSGAQLTVVRTDCQPWADVVRLWYPQGQAAPADAADAIVVDVLYESGTSPRYTLFVKPHIDSTATHGTGCTLSSAIATYLSSGMSVREATGLAIAFVQAAIGRGLTTLGSGPGPLNHACTLYTRGVLAPSAQGSATDRAPLSSKLISGSLSDWQAYVRHPFVTRLSARTLPRESFLWFLKQDYLFLRHYARVFACGAGSSSVGRTFDDVSLFAGMAAEMANEASTHVVICQRWGISKRELEFSTRESAATLAYTRYVLDIAHSGDALELLAATGPCLLGYGEVGVWLGQQLKANAGKHRKSESPEDDVAYDEWIERYAGEEFQSIVRVGIEGMERRAAEDPPSEARMARLQTIWNAAVRLEIGMWDEAVNVSLRREIVDAEL